VTCSWKERDHTWFSWRVISITGTQHEKDEVEGMVEDTNTVRMVLVVII